MYYRWVIVFACFIISITGYGTYFSVTLFYTHIVTEFDWSNSLVSGSISLGLIMYGVFALPMGWCADRFGPRITMIVAGLFIGGGTYLGFYISEPWHLYALYGGMTAIGMGGAWAPLVATISRWFEKQRGLAIGIGSIGGGIGTLFFAPLTECLIQELGWRLAYQWLGIISGILIITAALFLTKDPSTNFYWWFYTKYKLFRKQCPIDNAAVVSDALEQTLNTSSSKNLSKIIKDPIFWKMINTFGLWWFSGAIATVTLAPFALEKGFDYELSAAVVVAFALGNGIGRVVMGLAGDAVGELKVYQIGLISAGLATLGLIVAADLISIFLLFILLGIGFGGSGTQLTTISIKLFGLEAAGALMGSVLAIIGVFAAVGVFLSGLIHDFTDSYYWSYILCTFVFLLSALLSQQLINGRVRKKSENPKIQPYSACKEKNPRFD
ncbi:MFS transporter [Alphaproteobacteria bacterium]|nr:MFS transporter [Alphaproteobacteria bacterium]